MLEVSILLDYLLVIRQPFQLGLIAAATEVPPTAAS